MIYFEHMAKKFPGYEITEEDIKGILWYLQTNKDKNATREDAIKFLEENADTAHVLAHKIVEDERSGKIKPIKLKKD
jgi:hypothetical protein